MANDLAHIAAPPNPQASSRFPGGKRLFLGRLIVPASAFDHRIPVTVQATAAPIPRAGLDRQSRPRKDAGARTNPAKADIHDEYSVAPAAPLYGRLWFRHRRRAFMVERGPP